MSVNLQITSAEPNGTWETKDNRTFHKIKVTLSDGTTGEVNAQTPDRWKVGDEVIIKDRKDGPFGTTLKLDKPGYGQGYGQSAPSRGGRQDQIESQWAINAAISMYAAKAEVSGWTISDVKQVAKEMLKTRDEIIAEQ